MCAGKFERLKVATNLKVVYKKKKFTLYVNINMYIYNVICILSIIILYSVVYLF